MKKIYPKAVSLFFSALAGSVLFAGTFFGSPAAAQTGAADQVPESSAAQTAAPARVQAKAAPRKLGNHVFRKIDPALNEIHMVNTFNIKDGSQKDLPYSWAKNLAFFNDVWYFDFEIKSLRTIVLPTLVNVNGEKRPVLKKYLYLMYRIKNPSQYFTVQNVQTIDGVEGLKGRQEEVFGKYHEDAQTLREAASALYADGIEMPNVAELGAVEAMPMSYKFVVRDDKSLEFMPIFELRMADELWPDEKRRKLLPMPHTLIDENNAYVVRKIAEKERPSGRLHGSCDFIGKKIKPGEEVWGVAIWSDLNYTADRFSIVISGLTNVRKYEKDENKYYNKNLKLNYWHPGDLDIFRFGQPGGLDFEWIFE